MGRQEISVLAALEVIECPGCGFENPPQHNYCGNCGATVNSAPVEHAQRKPVTVLFCDVSGSTSLGESTDPEAVRALLLLYFERMRSIVEFHGGTVEKFIGDAVMAIFGVPHVHEDDALRGVRAALEMRVAVRELGIEAHIGVNSGEVVAGTVERLATGDAVNLAARLEQAAGPQEILIGSETYELLRDVLDATEVGPLDVKGKSAPVVAYRLNSVLGRRKRDDHPMVGRELELRILQDAYDGAVRQRSCQLVTVVGEAGVGKSRLADAFIERVDGPVVFGRCLSYGDGITYTPVVEMLRQLDVRPLQPAAAAAIAALLGETRQSTDPDEIAWAFRKALERNADEQPLVCIFEDVHWAEPVLLDLIEHVTAHVRGASILLLCLARPEFLERRNTWVGSAVNAITIQLEPLSEPDSQRLLHLLGDMEPRLARRITAAAGGNPLFLQEMVALARTREPGDVEVPRSLRSLLAARLDQLSAEDRDALECAAVEGLFVHRKALEAVMAKPDVTDRLDTLVEHGLLQHGAAVVADGVYRFAHQLIRDAAYESLPKSVRARSHESLGHWITEHDPDLVELDELVGYHLEQSCRYLRELGIAVPQELQSEARQRLTAAGRRAIARTDNAAAAKLMERAVAMLADDEVDVTLEFDLHHALHFSRRMDEAHVETTRAISRCAALGDHRGELLLQLIDGWTMFFIDPAPTIARLRVLVPEAIAEFERTADHLGLHAAFGSQWLIARQADDQLLAAERAIEELRLSGDTASEPVWVACAAISKFNGTTPVFEILNWLDECESHGHRNASSGDDRAAALAMLDRREEARAALESWRAEISDRATGFLLGYEKSSECETLLVLDDPEAAAEAGAEACRIFESIGEKVDLPQTRALLAEAQYRLGLFDAAAENARMAAAVGHPQAKSLQAKVLAQRGNFAEAELLAGEAISLADPQGLCLLGDAYRDLGEVLALAGKTDAARYALEEAADRYTRKGHIAGARRVAAMLADLARTAARV